MLTVARIPDFPLLAIKYTHDKHVYAIKEENTIVALSPRSRMRGLRLGDSVKKALSICPDAHIEARDPSAEAHFWNKTIRDIHAISPFMMPDSPGWITMRGLSRHESKYWAHSLGICFGSGPDWLTAKIAAVRAPTGHALYVTAANRSRFLEKSGLHILRSLEFDSESIDRLELFGLSSIKALLPLTKPQLMGQFGDPGNDIYAFLHNPLRPEEIPAFHPPELIQKSFSFDWPSENTQELYACLSFLLRECHRRLQGRLASAIVVRAAFRSGEKQERTRLLSSPSCSLSSLHTHAQALLLSLLQIGEPCTLLNVRLFDLREPSPQQLILFQKRPSVFPFIQEINKKYPDALFRIQIGDPWSPFHEDRIQRTLFDFSTHETTQKRRARNG